MTDLSQYTDYEAAPNGDFEPIPNGVYVAQIVEGEIANTKSGGVMVKWTWKIEEGEHAGRLIWHNINLVNSNPKAQQIGQAEQAAIRAAIGKPTAASTEDYCFIPCLIRVGLEIDKSGQYKPKNKVEAVKPLTQNVTAFAGAMNAGATSAPPARPASPPPGAPKAASAAGTFSFRR
jgi:hypothetical protein